MQNTVNTITLRVNSVSTTSLVGPLKPGLSDWFFNKKNNFTTDGLEVVNVKGDNARVKCSYCVESDGSTGYIELDPSLITLQKDFKISLSVLASTSNTTNFISFYEGTKLVLFRKLSGDTFNFYVRDASGESVNTSISCDSGVWNRFEVSWDSSTKTATITDGTNTDTSTNSNITFGGFSEGELCRWHSAYGATKQCDVVVTCDGSEVLNLPLQGSCYDVSGNGNHGTNHGCTWAVQDQYHYNLLKGYGVGAGGEFVPRLADDSGFPVAVTEEHLAGFNNMPESYFEFTDNVGISDFKATFRVANDGDSITLPLVSGYTYNFVVDWGDNSTDTITTFDDTNRVHAYTIAGDYQITVKGVMQYWNFYTVPASKNQILTIDQNGAQFLNNVESYANMFRECSILVGGDGFSQINTSSVTNMFAMFYNCQVFNQDIGSWDVSNVTNIGWMFYHCSLFNQDIGSWDVSNITDLYATFNNCSSFNQDIGSWDVSNVTNMYRAFYFCTSFNQDIGSWDVSSATKMYRVFYGCSMFNQDISSWDVSNVTDMGGMFYECHSFNQDISSWDVSNVTKMVGMFHNVILSTANYDALLTGWNSLASLQANVDFDGGLSKYSAGAPATARANIIATYGWTITDGGLV